MFAKKFQENFLIKIRFCDKRDFFRLKNLKINFDRMES